MPNLTSIISSARTLWTSAKKKLSSVASYLQTKTSQFFNKTTEQVPAQPDTLGQNAGPTQQNAKLTQLDSAADLTQLDSANQFGQEKTIDETPYKRPNDLISGSESQQNNKQMVSSTKKIPVTNVTMLVSLVAAVNLLRINPQYAFNLALLGAGARGLHYFLPKLSPPIILLKNQSPRADNSHAQLVTENSESDTNVTPTVVMTPAAIGMIFIGIVAVAITCLRASSMADTNTGLKGTPDNLSTFLLALVELALKALPVAATVAASGQQITSTMSTISTLTTAMSMFGKTAQAAILQTPQSLPAAPGNHHEQCNTTRREQ